MIMNLSRFSVKTTMSINSDIDMRKREGLLSVCVYVCVCEYIYT